jgi:hypothetical protein
MRLLRLARREAEADRAALDARLLAVLEQMPTAVLVVDAVRRSAVYANQGTTALMAQLAAHAATPRGAALLGTRMETLHPDLAKVGALLADPGRLPHFGRLAFGPETADFVISPVGETGRTVAFTLTWWLSTAQGRVAERFEIEVKTVVERLLGTAGELSASSAEVTATIEATRRETGAVSEAADQLAAAIREICAGSAGQAGEREGRCRGADLGRADRLARPIRRCDRQHRRHYQRDRRPHQPAGAQRYHRGRARRCRRPGLRGGGTGAQDARRPDCQGHRRHRRPGDRDPSVEVVTASAGIGRVIEEIAASWPPSRPRPRNSRPPPATRACGSRASPSWPRSDAAATTIADAVGRVDEAGGAHRTGVDCFLENARRL